MKILLYVFRKNHYRIAVGALWYSLYLTNNDFYYSFMINQEDIDRSHASFVNRFGKYLIPIQNLVRLHHHWQIVIRLINWTADFLPHEKLCVISFNFVLISTSKGSYEELVQQSSNVPTHSTFVRVFARYFSKQIIESPS